MKFNSFTSHNAGKSSFLTDDTAYNLSKKVRGKYRYNIRIEIGIILLLLGLYFFMAYSFLQMSSGLLLLSDKSDQIKYHKQFIYPDNTSDQTIVDKIIVVVDKEVFIDVKSNASIVKETLHDVPSRPELSVFLKSVFATTRLSQKNTQTIIS
ncbi:hypothetical protein ABW636_22200 [Aquimarina sp. 2201CG1-2-11]|uniref:hypothetical protein n=1 Tax=Aquimarina discodermiae TaxID=3231043 RepID=UPI0034637D93